MLNGMSSEGDAIPNGHRAIGQSGGGGTLLAGGRLRETLRTEYKVFRPDTWTEDRIKGAGYELRLASDSLIIPEAPGSDSHRNIEAGAPDRADKVVLAPGDSALISTEERFCLDFDLSAQIGPKFRWSAEGLLILQGMAAHPGYGRELSDEGQWRAKEDERLYFVVANVGPEPILMRPGDPIAYLQIFEVESESPTGRRETPNVGFNKLSRIFREGAASPGLAYFRNVRDLERKVEADRIARDKELSVLSAQLERVRTAADTVVVFGVFLVAATLLGVVVVTLIDAVQALPEPTRLDDSKTAWIAGLSVVYALAVIGGVIAAVVAVRAGIRAPRDAKGKPEPAAGRSGSAPSSKGGKQAMGPLQAQHQIDAKNNGTS